MEFDFTGPRGRRVWLLLEPREVSVCVTPPGFDSDLIVRADLAFFYRVWLGHIEYDAAIRCRSVVVEGLPALAKQLPRWFMWSPMARFVREREHPVAHASDMVRATERRAVSLDTQINVRDRCFADHRLSHASTSFPLAEPLHGVFD